ncbi:MAG: Uma2 family endonuclease [Lachnospiraceae bacterium]|nr:Uma2 family endonuclease [Lachnospiraceae bacterium]
MKLYQKTGVQEYWIVDAEKKAVTIYRAGHWNEPAHHCFSGRIKWEFLKICIWSFHRRISCNKKRYRTKNCRAAQ